MSCSNYSRDVNSTAVCKGTYDKGCEGCEVKRKRSRPHGVETYFTEDYEDLEPDM